MASLLGYVLGSCRISRPSTFLPPRNAAPEGSQPLCVYVPDRSQLKKLAESTLGSGNLNVAVRLPEGERLEEWVAVHSTLQRLTQLSTFLITSTSCTVP